LSLNKEFDNLKKAILKEFEPILLPVVRFLSKLLNKIFNTKEQK